MFNTKCKYSKIKKNKNNNNNKIELSLIKIEGLRN